MITIFSPMRPFRADIAKVQLNAIQSWLAIRPACEVILVDDEEGTTPQAVQGMGVRVISEVKRSGLGAPLLGDLLETGAANARHEILAYITADILLPPNFATTTLELHAMMKGRAYFAVGGRVDLTRPTDMHFGNPDWSGQLAAAVKNFGKLRKSGLDLWVYPKTLHLDAPPFPIGRWGTDGWAVYNARKKTIPVIDFTSEILLIHQFHTRPAKRDPRFYEEQIECVRLFRNMAEDGLSVLDADWILSDGRLKRPRGVRRIHSWLAMFRPYRFLLGWRRKILRPELYRQGAIHG